MTEHPLIFSAVMIPLLLDGSKTQDRRPLKFKDPWQAEQPREKLLCKPEFQSTPGAFTFTTLDARRVFVVKSPYQPGDRIWVQETWYVEFGDHGDVLRYRADVGMKYLDGLWKPPLYMPRRASRITLEVSEVRVQRLWDISSDDVMAEGCQDLRTIDAPEPRYRIGPVVECHCELEAFAMLWDSLYAKRGFGWDLNPWVRAISFRRLP